MSKIITYEHVREFIESEGYSLLSKEYKNNMTKMDVICSKGHQYKTTWANFRQGYRCNVCSINNRRFTYKEVKEHIESTGYKFLSKEYKKIDDKITLMCIKGHIYNVTYNHFKRGRRCHICSGSKKYDYDDIKQKMKNEEYKLISKRYNNAFGKLDIICPYNHEFKMRWNDFQQGHRCPKCVNKECHSKLEKEVLEIVKNITEYNIIANDRNQIINPLTNRYLELDIWIPSLKKAIEFNGTYWHDNEYSKYKDIIKKEQCKRKEIDLLVIDENDWRNDKSKCIDTIGEWLNEN